MSSSSTSDESQINTYLLLMRLHSLPQFIDLHINLQLFLLMKIIRGRYVIPQKLIITISLQYVPSGKCLTLT
jgi:hypothetical protein